MRHHGAAHHSLFPPNALCCGRPVEPGSTRSGPCTAVRAHKIETRPTRAAHEENARNLTRCSRRTKSNRWHVRPEQRTEMSRSVKVSPRATMTRARPARILHLPLDKLAPLRNHPVFREFPPAVVEHLGTYMTRSEEHTSDLQPRFGI